ARPLLSSRRCTSPGRPLRRRHQALRWRGTGIGPTIGLPLTQENGPMIRFVHVLRLVTLIASLGIALGAILMFWLGAAKLASGLGVVFTTDEAAVTTVITTVMEATDAFLFGLVLIVFAYGIMFSFAFELPGTVRAKLPSWMRVGGIGELKNTLIEIILLYLIVDFATDVAEAEMRV